MNKGITIAVSLLAGASVGAFFGWFITKKKCDEQSQEDINSIIEKFTEMANEKDRELAEAAKNKPSLEEIVKEKAYVNDISKQTDEEVASTNYSIFSEKFIPDDDSSSVDEIDDEPEIEEESSSLNKLEVKMNNAIDIPYIITANEFVRDNDYDKLTFIKYMDGVFADEYGDEISDAKNYISEKIMDYIESSDKHEIYVRNDAREVDVEVIVEPENYYVKEEPEEE